MTGEEQSVWASLLDTPGSIETLTITNTAAFRSQEIPLSIASVAEPHLRNSRSTRIQRACGIATWRAIAKGLSKEVKAGLIHPYHDWESRIATLRFVEDIPLKPAHPNYATLTEVWEEGQLFKDHPMLILLGRSRLLLHTQFPKDRGAKIPQCSSSCLGRCRALCHGRCSKTRRRFNEAILERDIK